MEGGRGKGRRWKAVALAGAVVAAAALAAAFALLSMQGRASAPEPSPGTGAGTSALAEDGMWPEVDWEWWRGVNPDVIGWISIPGTGVSQPIVQARPEDPGYYLSHDVYGDWNPWGAVYLDAECAEGGLFGSPNAVVYGHHMDDGSMFAELVGYSDAEWAAGHAAVLVQTPDERREYRVRYADVVDNAAMPKRVSFAGKADYESWYEDGLTSAAAVVDPEERPDQAISLVTCSYWWTTDERTVAVCSDGSDHPGIWGEKPPSGRGAEEG